MSRPCGLCKSPVQHTKAMGDNLYKWELLYGYQRGELPLLCVACWILKNNGYVADLKSCAEIERKQDPEAVGLAALVLGRLGVPFHNNKPNNLGFACLAHVPTSAQRELIEKELLSSNSTSVHRTRIQFSQTAIRSAMFSREDSLESLWRTSNFAHASPCLMSLHDLAAFTKAVLHFTLAPTKEALTAATAAKEIDVSIQRLTSEDFCHIANWDVHWRPEMNEVVASSVVDFLQNFLREEATKQAKSDQAPRLSLEMPNGPGVTYYEETLVKAKSTRYSSTKPRREVNEQTAYGMLSNVPSETFSSKTRSQLRTFYMLLIRNNGANTGELRSVNASLPVMEPCTGIVSDATTGLFGILHYLAMGSHLHPGSYQKKSSSSSSTSYSSSSSNAPKPHPGSFSSQKQSSFSSHQHSGTKKIVNGPQCALLSFSAWSGLSLPMDEEHSHICFARNIHSPPMFLPGHPEGCKCERVETMIVGALHIIRAKTGVDGCLACHQVTLVYPSTRPSIYLSIHPSMTSPPIRR